MLKASLVLGTTGTASRLDMHLTSELGFLYSLWTAEESLEVV